MIWLFACAPAEDLHDSRPEDSGAPAWDERYDLLGEVLEQERQRLGAPGLGVAVVQDGQLVWSAGLGSAHPDQDQAFTGSALFRIGSVTKMMTATGLLQQMQAGLAEPDTLVSSLIPVETISPDDYAALTLHQLLSHQSGLFDHTPIEGSEKDEKLSNYTHGTWARSYSWHMVQPGSFWNYSNPNFALAGLAAEVLDGRFYRQILTEDVFGPLGMDRAFFLGEEVLADGDYAVGDAYDWTGATTERRLSLPDSYDHAWSRPAGFAWVSPEQLARFGDFLIQGNEDVLDAQHHAMLTEPHVRFQYAAEEVDGRYAYGVMPLLGVETREGWVAEPVLWHNGAIPGFSADLYAFPDRGVSVAILGNTDGAYVSSDALLEGLAEAIDFPAATPMPDPAIAEDLSVYAGTYFDAYNIGTVRVTYDAGRLLIECPTLENYGYVCGEELVPYDEDLFLLDLSGQWLGVSLLPGPDHESQYLRHRAFVAHRVETEARAADVRPRVEALLASPPTRPQPRR
jgi:CubicO group peptidase (beta-lactamase class C family)